MTIPRNAAITINRLFTYKNKKQSDKNEWNFETLPIYVQKLNYIKYFDPIRSKYFS